MTIGARLEHARKLRKMTQTQLGLLVDRTKGAVSQWENGQAQPDLDVLARICDALRVSADYIVRGIDAQYLTSSTLELARRIAALPDDQRAALEKVFGPAAPDERVAQFLPPAPRRKPQK